MFVMAKHDELPDEMGKLRLIPDLEGIDCLNVTNDPIKVAADSINAIGLRAGTVDGAGQYTDLVLHQRFQNLLLDVIEISAISDCNLDTFVVRIFQDVKQMWIQEDFPII